MNEFAEEQDKEVIDPAPVVVTESTIESQEEPAKEEYDPDLDKFLHAEKLFLILTNSGKPVYSS